MATFSINQVRHFYVVNSTTDVEAKVSSDKKSLRFTYNSPGGKEGTDIIDVDKILYVKQTPATKMEITLKQSTITIPATDLVANEVYAVKVFFTNYAGGGDDNITVKYGEASLTKAEAEDSNPNNVLATKLKASLEKNLVDLVPMAEVSVDANVITIKETDQPWEAGVKPFTVMPFTVELLPVGDSADWATVVNKANSSAKVTNAKRIADMEWFYSGSRGDMYRGYGHPHGVRTKLVADGTTACDIIDIHYAYVGPNEGAQKSEKTITFAGTASNLKAVINALAAVSVPGFTTQS